MGKWLAAWTFASVVAVLTLSGFVAAALLYAQKKLATLMAFGFPELVQFVAMALAGRQAGRARRPLGCGRAARGRPGGFGGAHGTVL